MNTDMLPSMMRLFKHHYRQAHVLALTIVEAKARRILAHHRNLDEFVMAMGTYTFTDKNGNSVDYRYLEPFDKFMREWNDCFNLTGEPMRFTAKGKYRRDW